MGTVDLPAPKFFSVPGMAPTGGEGGMNARNTARLPDITAPEHDAQLGDWLRSRGPTSHQTTGLEKGDSVWFDDVSGERRAGIVLGEERDQHSGKVDVHLAVNDPNGSGTYRQTWEANGERGMAASQTKRVFE